MKYAVYTTYPKKKAKKLFETNNANPEGWV